VTAPLSRLRFSADQSRGRRYPQPSHRYRNEFQRDRDRVIHSRAFRRLEDKTQVFGAGYSDHFRSRLTHTIEVAQVARTVAAVLGLDEDLTETLALVHDIGHPPFGHAGETALDAEMQRFGERFDHNIHALRLVEGFERRYANFPGLNLTFEVREGIVKHSRDIEPGEDPLLEEYLPGLKPPLEAQIIDLADEAAYNTADLDDAHQEGMLTFQEAAAIDPLLAEIAGAVETQFPGASERLRFQELLRRLVDLLVSGLIEGMAGIEASTIEQVRHAPQRLAAMTPDAARSSAALKRFLTERVYNSPELVAARSQSAARISALFRFFLDHPDRMPPGYQATPRAVCDYIAGMTDSFFRSVAREMLLLD
jgi:dGTPase